MQGQDPFSITRRALDVEDYIDIARRHKSWIIGPFFACVVVSVVGAFLWPNTYVSNASIKVLPQQVPEAFVQSNVNQQMTDRISSMAQTVLSRNALTTMITSFDLYPRERGRLPTEDVVEMMRKDVKISSVANLAQMNARTAVPAFQISFAYTDRYKAQRVVSEIQTKFIDESIRERSQGSRNTNALLLDQWEAAKKEMEGLDTRLAEFRAQHQGRLPDQVDSSLQQMNAMQTRLMNLNGAISRVQQEKLGYETQLRILKDQIGSLKEPGNVEMQLGKSEKVIEAEREVSAYERQLAALREHYKDSYPGVQTVINMLQASKAKLAQAQKDDAARKPEKMAANPSIAREARELDAAYKRIQSAIEAKDLEAEEYRREMGQVNASLRNLQGRLESVPLSEKVYTELIRDRDLAKQKYLDLDAKKTRSDLANKMEDRKIGESLEALDQASLPKTPSKPKREIIIGAGAAVGLLMGILMAGVREMKDSSLKNLKDVRAYTQLPILGSIPLLENDLVVRRRRRLAWLGWSLASLAGVVMMTGSVVYYFVTKA